MCVCTFLWSSSDNFAIKNHCPRALTLFPQGWTLLLVEGQGKGSDGDVTSVAIVMSWPSQAKWSQTRLFLAVVQKGRCTVQSARICGRYVTYNHAPLRSQHVIKKCWEIWVSLEKPKRENEQLLGLVLKTELEPRFIFWCLTDHLDRAIKENNEVS